jgi:hypothetical protein
VTVEPQEAWSGVFGGHEVEFHFVIKSSADFQGRAEATFLISEVRKIPVSKSAIASGAGKAAKMTVRFAVPPVKPGIMLQAVLRVAVYAYGQEKPVAVFDKPLRI